MNTLMSQAAGRHGTASDALATLKQPAPKVASDTLKGGGAPNAELKHRVLYGLNALFSELILPKLNGQTPFIWQTLKSCVVCNGDAL